MSFFQRLPFNSVRKKSQNGSGIDPSLISQQPVVLGSSAPTPSRPKNLAEIEKEIEEQTRNHRIYPYNRGTKKRSVYLVKSSGLRYYLEFLQVWV